MNFRQTISGSQFRQAIASVSALFLTLFLFGPGSIYLTNAHEYSISYADVLLWGVALFAGFVTAAVLFLLLTHKYGHLHTKITAAAISITFLLYLQGNFMVWNYGTLDGRGIDWSEHKLEGLLDAIAWIGIILISFIKAPWIAPRALPMCTALIAVQTISTGFYLYKLPETPNFKQYSIDQSNKFQFSKNKNVIIFVLDSFQTDFFQEILNEDTSYLKTFAAFTYFRNALAGHPFTETSTMNILTGKFYEGVESFERHNKIAYSGASIPRVLRSNGFEVDVFPGIKRSIYFNEFYFSNVKNGPLPISEKAEEISSILDLSLFRYLPTVLKTNIYRDGDWFLTKRRAVLKVLSGFHNSEYDSRSSKLGISTKAIDRCISLQFLDRMTTEAKRDTEKNVFKYYHLDLPHWPLIINESLEFEPMSVNRANYKRQCYAALNVMKLALEKLKRIGAFDNSLIFIIADHGAGAQKQKFLATSGFKVPEDEELISQQEMLNAVPLFLAKPAGSKGDFKITDSPVSLSDIPATVFSEHGIETGEGQQSIFQIHETDQRERRYLSYEKYDAETDRYPHVQEWFINGYGWLLGSWNRSHRIFTNQGPKLDLPDPYRLGEVIHFNDPQKVKKYASYGWSTSYEQPKATYTWTVGPSASLAIPVHDPKTNLIFTMRAVAYLGNNALDSQRVSIKANGHDIGNIRVSYERDYQVIIPSEFLKPDILNIRFHLPDALSPSKANAGDDDRQLGIAVQSIQLTPLPDYAPGERIYFRRSGTSGPYLGTGWSLPTNEFNWTSGKNAELLIPMNKSASDLVLHTQVVPYLAAGKVSHQLVKIFANDVEIGMWQVAKPGTYSAGIPVNIHTRNRMLKLRFQLPSAISPKDAGAGTDQRQLALAFYEIRIDEAGGSARLDRK